MLGPEELDRDRSGWIGMDRDLAHGADAMHINWGYVHMLVHYFVSGKRISVIMYLRIILMQSERPDLQSIATIEITTF